MAYPYYMTKQNAKIEIQDSEILNAIAHCNNLTQYVRIQILNMNDELVENGTIQGRVTGGNLSLNASSPVRRSGSLSLVADESNCDITNLKNIIAINKRARIEIGVENVFGIEDIIDNKIWYPFGTFVLTNANITKNLSGLNISVTLKDKMALLNGECGGVIYTTVTHSPLYNADGTETPVVFSTLITELVSEWGKIPEEKIDVQGLNRFINNTYSWHGAQPLYVGVSFTEETVTPYYADLQQRNIENIEHLEFVAGEAVGYSYKENTYPGELTSAVGETVTSVLDKIKKALGNFEYFFDVDGKFIFRPIPNYLNEGSGMDNLTDAFGEGYLTVSTNKEVDFNFENEELLVSCANQPKYEAIKNDYVVWGAKGESKMPIRYHLVIDNKPAVDQMELGKKESIWCYTDKFGVLRAVPKDQTVEDAEKQDIQINDWRAWLYYDYVVNGNYNDYGQELQVEFPKQYDLINGTYYHEQGDDVAQKARLYDLNYWLDFLDPNEIDEASVKDALNDISVTNIGRKTKTVKDESINCIFNIRPLDLIFIPTGKPDTAAMREAAGENNKTYIQIGPDIASKMSFDNWNNAAYDTIRAVIHETTAYNNVINLTCIPIFHLEPSMRINVNVKEGEKPIAVGHYMINSINVPLAYNGTMTINASRAIERI